MLGKLEIENALRREGINATVSDAVIYPARLGWYSFRISFAGDESRGEATLRKIYNVQRIDGLWLLRKRSQPIGLVMAGGSHTPPTPPTPTDGPLYFEAVQANSTVSLMSMLATAPNLEYSEDGETWQEWQHTTQEIQGVTLHVFDTLTLSEIGDKIYIKGDNPNGMSESSEIISIFGINGSINAGGKLVSIIDSTMQMTTLPPFAFNSLFMADSMTGINTAPSLDNFTVIGEEACEFMFAGQPLNHAADMSNELTLGDNSLANMYYGCTFDMSDDGTTLNFDFPSPPITTTGDNPQTYATAYDVAQWMGNTNGFSEP